MWPFNTPAPPTNTPIPTSACPVDPSLRSTYSTPTPSTSSSSAIPLPRGRSKPQRDADIVLSEEREVSTIPRWLPSTSSSSSASSSGSATLGTEPETCPARSTPSSSSSSSSSSVVAPTTALTPPEGGGEALPTESPKNENWVYPSPSSFYRSLVRKEREPAKKDMVSVVPIHNAVNERVWEMVKEWEREAVGRGRVDQGEEGSLRRLQQKGGEEGVGERGESKLVSFKGRPKDLSPRARFKGWIGYSAPFDRHDWIVDRPLPTSSSSSSSSSTTDEPQSIRIRYVIDFYSGRLPTILSPDSSSSAASSSTGTGRTSGSEEIFRPNLAFYLDVRPALDDFEGVRMRTMRAWRNTLGMVGIGDKA